MSSIGVPLIFEPLYVERVWGGNRLGKVFGKNLPVGKTIGETWELCDRVDAQTKVTGGPFDGWTIRKLMETHPEALLGKELAARKPKFFPLLIKYIDAGHDLSVQVHPDDMGALALGYNDRGKTECWVVVQADPGAKIQRGLKPGVTREQFEGALNAGKVETVLHFFTPKIGDVVAIPPGMIHAIGKGMIVAEIQQNSDVTFRVFDYNRVGLDGKPRALHVQESLKSTCFDGDFGDYFQGDMKTEVRSDAIGPVLQGRYFDLWVDEVPMPCQTRIHPQTGTTLSQSPASPAAPRILMFLRGEGLLNGQSIKAGQTVLLPADVGPLELKVTHKQGLKWASSRPTPEA